MSDERVFLLGSGGSPSKTASIEENAGVVLRSTESGKGKKYTRARYHFSAYKQVSAAQKD